MAATALAVRSHSPVPHRPRRSSQIAPQSCLAVGIPGRRSQPLPQGRSSTRRTALGPSRPPDLRPEVARGIHPGEQHEIAQHRFRSRVPQPPVRHRSRGCRQDKFSGANPVFPAFWVNLHRFQTSGGFERTEGVRGIGDQGSNDLRRSEQSSISPGRRPSAMSCGPGRDARTGPSWMSRHGVARRLQSTTRISAFRPNGR